MDLDNFVSHFLVNIPYLFIESPSNDYKLSRRYYFVHENTDVYVKNEDSPFQLYTFLKDTIQRDLYLINPNTHKKKSAKDVWCKNYFMVLNPYSLKGDEDLRINGKKLKFDPKGFDSVYEFLWCKSLKNESLCEIKSEMQIYNKKKDIKIFKSECSKNLGNYKPYEIDEKYLELSNNIDFYATSIRNQERLAYPKREFIEYIEEIHPNFPRRKYSKKITPIPPNIHWGQTKLLLSEIEFLTNYTRPTQKNKKKGSDVCGTIVVYAGAASGNHIPILSRMFPYTLFILFDPADFAILPSPNIIIRKGLFTDQIASLYKGFKVMFISDIRMGDEDPKKFEENVAKNNKQQKVWLDIIEPWNSSLKFRFPFIPGEERYIAGSMRFQSFPPPLSAETRLIPDKIGGKYSSRVYSRTKYEEQMLYFNTMYRNRSFLDLDSFFGVNYDVFRMFNILKRYILVTGGIWKYSHKVDNILLGQMVMSIVFEIEHILGKNVITNILKPLDMYDSKQEKLSFQ